MAAKQSILITKGQEAALVMAFTHQDGSSYDLTGATVTLSVAKDSQTAPILDRVAVTDGSTATVALTADDTDVPVRAYQAVLSLLDAQHQEASSRVFYIQITERVVVPGTASIVVGANTVELTVDVTPPANTVDKYYRQDFTVTDALTVTHNLNKRPAITVVDSAGDEVVVDVQYMDDNNVHLMLAGAFSGSVYCS